MKNIGHGSDPASSRQTASDPSVSDDDATKSALIQAAVEIVPGGRVEGVIRPPGSKSLTNRALVCAAFAEGNSTLSGALSSEDTEVMIDALRAVGVSVDVQDGGRRLRVDGSMRHRGTSSDEPTDLFIANSGTTVRFLTAALSALGGSYRLHGVDRMHKRPIGDLINALRPVQSGVITTESTRECPPVLLRSDGWEQSELLVSGTVSSQYLSGLMMASPISGRQTRIRVQGELVSRPYVDMTAAVMKSFGAVVDIREGVGDSADGIEITIGPQPYQSTDYAIEPDASAASYFWAAAAITGGKVTVEGLSRDALQGDVGFCDVLQQMGCSVQRNSESLTVTGGRLTGIDVDMNEISDTVQTLSVVALFADGPTSVRGVAHNRFKETDRIGDLARELRKLGAKIDEHEDGLTITPPSDERIKTNLNEGSISSHPRGGGLHGASLSTYHDHRMAMSLSLAGLRIPGVRILDPSCTAKTYPEFFADLESLIARPHRWYRE